MAQLKNVKVLTTAAMLVAVGIILGFLKVPITNLIEIRFGSLPIAVGGALCGPFISAVIGALVDIGGYLVKPTGAFFPGFTISGIVSGIIFGLIFYKKEITVVRVIVAQVIHTIVISLLLNTLWLSILYGNPFTAVFISRLPAQLIMCPINAVILYAVLKPIAKLRPALKLEEAYAK